MSGTIQTPIAKFRESMGKFIIKLRVWAANDESGEQLKELDKIQMKYDMGMKVNPKASLVMFINALEPHADYILAGDESYLTDGHVQVEDEYNQLLSRVKCWWPQLDHKQKHYIKKQFQLLFMLGSMAIKHEGMRIIINRHRDVDNPLIW
jgi:hypothetical protein